MKTLSVRDYRNNLASSFNKAANGETVFIRRRNQLYALISIGPEELTVTPELQARIAEAEEAHKAGKTVTCRSKEDLKRLIDSL